MKIAQTTTTRAPDFRGVGEWKAWRCRLPTVLEKPDHQATVAGWLLFCPGAHLAWSYWWITLVHLRDIPGVPPAKLRFPGAGWEVLCMAQEPDHAPDPDDATGTLRFLTPLDWVVQFGDVANDEQATRVIEAVVDLIMSGRVSPDQDFRSFWMRSIPDTAACHATGKHERN